MLYVRSPYHRAAQAEHMINAERMPEIARIERRKLRATGWYRREVAWYLDELAALRRLPAHVRVLRVDAVPYYRMRLDECRRQWLWVMAGCPDQEA